MNIKYFFIIFAIFSFVFIEISKSNEDTFKVEYRGALKNMMHKGDISAKANLSELKKIKHIFALGAVENLKGEIQIFDSKVFITSVNDSNLVFDSTFNKKATLLVYASVEKWKTINIPDSISTHDQLEKYIADIAFENKLNIDKPFPFLIEGRIKSFDWHVINWRDGDMEHSHEKHIKSGLFGTENNRQVELLGFYSNSHHTIFTHHSTNMHIHFKTVDNELAGHVDSFILGQKMILKLPEEI